MADWLLAGKPSWYLSNTKQSQLSLPFLEEEEEDFA